MTQSSLEFPISSQGEFISTEELQAAQKDSTEIDRISQEYKVVREIISKDPVTGEFLIKGMKPEDFADLYSGNDNSEMYK